MLYGRRQHRTWRQLDAHGDVCGIERDRIPFFHVSASYRLVCHPGDVFDDDIVIVSHEHEADEMKIPDFPNSTVVKR